VINETFHTLLNKYSDDARVIQKMWHEISVNYSAPQRHYHTLSHLENLITELQFVSDKIFDWDTLLFAVFYHDLIYKSTSSKNEEESAEIASRRLSEIGYPTAKITKCLDMIIATKGHSVSNDPDTNFFIDADLSILGKNWDAYSTYMKQIRKEFAVYPNLIYNPGRKKVLRHFLEMEKIFKTDHFSGKYEVQARQNILKELELL
jgi:predicted metal-dependent HD superfamily phosphohydrolase